MMRKKFMLVVALLMLLIGCSSAGGESEVLEGEGILKQREDTDMITIESQEGEQSFHLTEEAQEDVDYIEVGDEVKFTHYHHGKKQMIEFIEQGAHYDQPRHHHRHHEHRMHYKHQQNHHRMNN